MLEVLKQKYLTSFEDKILLIKRALETSDIQVLSTMIHQLAGSSGSYGFTNLSDLCLKIEQMIIDKKDYGHEIKPAIEQLVTMMEQISQTENQ